MGPYSLVIVFVRSFGLHVKEYLYSQTLLSQTQCKKNPVHYKRIEGIEA